MERGIVTYLVQLLEADCRGSGGNQR